MCTDEALAKRCFTPNRDDRACEELYKKYKDIAIGLAWRFLNDVYDAQDAFHDAWYSLLGKREFEHFNNFRAFLFKAVKNHALMLLRKRRTRHTEFQVSLNDPTYNSDSSTEPMLLHETIENRKATQDREYMELLQDIETVLRPRLSPRAYQAFTLVMVDRLTHAEAGVILNCSRKTVQRACKQAIELLIKYGLLRPKRSDEENENGTSES